MMDAAAYEASWCARLDATLSLSLCVSLCLSRTRDDRTLCRHRLVSSSQRACLTSPTVPSFPRAANKPTRVHSASSVGDDVSTRVGFDRRVPSSEQRVCCVLIQTDYIYTVSLFPSVRRFAFASSARRRRRRRETTRRRAPLERETRRRRRRRVHAPTRARGRRRRRTVLVVVLSRAAADDADDAADDARHSRRGEPIVVVRVRGGVERVGGVERARWGRTVECARRARGDGAVRLAQSRARTQV